VVPNRNGEAFLRRGIGSLALSARATKLPYELIVVDDASQDGGADLVEREFPSVRLVRRSEGRGFGETANEGVALARGGIVILAGNDLIVREEFCARLLEAMGDDDVFAAGAKTLDWNGVAPSRAETSAVWRQGLLAQAHSDPDEPCETVFVPQAACAVRREEFLAMGGFSPLFAPGPWEEGDLSYWARKKGFRAIYQPLAFANCVGGAMLAEGFGREQVEILRRRNQILLTWLNLSDAGLWARHLVEFPAAVVRDLARGENSALAKGLLRALRRIPAVMAQRRRRRGTFRTPDREILR
jgi:GT2 family glycosyltransferase